MLVPVSWLKEFVDIDIPAELLAERLTVAGLEVVKIHYIGVPQTAPAHLHLAFKTEVRYPQSDHLVWDTEKIVLGAIKEIKAHPNADKLVLAMVDYGGSELEQCVTGAPNLFEYKDKGPLPSPLWAPFAKEGAEVWDGHSDEPKRMILKERALRGIPNRCMVCSEKELGLSDEHEGILLLEDPNMPPGTPLQDVLGDVVLEVEFTPNLARCFSILGVAREIAALLDKEVRLPSFDYIAEGASIEGQAFIEIHEPELNPRFTATLLRDTEIRPSPQWMQRRLKLVGQRPINNIVDVTNYITFEIGQPLHAYDYDKLVARAGGKSPTIITRLAAPGEMLETLDEVKRQLDPHNILVCDTAGVLGLGGVIGGAETEISDTTKNVLLEAANWNFINIRRTMQSQKVFTDASMRFSRGVHPSQAILGVQRGIELMRQTGGGKVAQGVIDVYPLPPETPAIDLPSSEIRRILGMEISVENAADMLIRLGFDVTIVGDSLHVIAPDHRTDIGMGVIGQADLIEEIARIIGYDQIPDTIIEDQMPPQWANVALEREEWARDILVSLGLRENVSYRFTTPEREALLTPEGMPSSLPQNPYIEMANPIASDKTVLRRTILVNLLENTSANARYQQRQAVFEIGAVYLKGDDPLPDEPRRLGILMTGLREPIQWMGNGAAGNLDYFDLKGVVEGLLEGLHIYRASYGRGNHSSFHPGRSAELSVKNTKIGAFGEIHPLVAQAFGLTETPVMMAEFDLDVLLHLAQDNHPVKPLPTTPPVLQDIAIVVLDTVSAADVEMAIVRSGGEMLKDVRLFDVYRGDPIPQGHKSLAYNLVYQADDRTLTDSEVAKVHQKIVKYLEHEVGAKVRKPDTAN
jgi:phenylalanyl-tRNA synthetase beta chain